MVTYTPILKLAKPVFDQTPWDQEINGDLNIIDSAIGNFFGIANYIGLWRNGTAYVAGQVVTDAVDSSMWTCAISHTSAATGTFADDRAAYPLNWTKQIASASDLAQQAATSASAAAASASAAAASAATVNNALPLAGGTMTGFITLHADPSSIMQAATKQYVDARVGGTSFLPITGGGITGNLSVSGQFSVSGPSYLGSTIRAYVSGQSPSIYGGRDGVGFAGMYLGADAAIYFSSMDANGVPTAHRASITPAGSLNAVQQVTAPYLWSSGSIAWGGGASFLSSDGDSSVVNFTTDNWRLYFQRATGNLIYINSAGAWLSWTDGGGTFHALGLATSNDLNANGVYGNWIRSYGSAQVDGNLVVNGTTTFSGVTTANDIHTGAISTTNAQVNNYLGCSGNATVVGLITTTAIQCNTNLNTASLSCGGEITCNSMVANNDIRSHNNLIAEGRGYQPGGGLWIALSDARIKTVSGPYSSTLAELVQLDPVRYNLKDNHYRTDPNYHADTTYEYIGLVAQQVEGVMPELVTQVDGYIDGVAVSDMREYNGSALIYAVINSLKEISLRLDALEAARR